VQTCALPISGDQCLGTDDFVWTVKATDANLYALEIDHNIGALPEFTVYADADNPWGDQAAADQASAVGLNLTYTAAGNDGTWTFTFDRNGSAWNTIYANGGITFYTVLSDCNINELGSMSPTTPANTFAYTFDNAAPTDLVVTPAAGDQCLGTDDFVWTVKATDANLYALEIDHNI